MTIDQPLAASLKAVGELMNAAHDPWWIIASAAVALHGADAGHVADVDVLLSIGDAQLLLPTIGLEVRRGPDHAHFRSDIFGIWTQPPLPVEFMAGFCYRSGMRWLPVQPETRRAIELDNIVLFVPDQMELGQILRCFGRPKDTERADRLAALES